MLAGRELVDLDADLGVERLRRWTGCCPGRSASGAAWRDDDDLVTAIGRGGAKT